MAVRDTVENGHCDCFEKHDVSSEHRDKLKFTEFPERRDESKLRRVIKNSETDQNSRKEHRDRFHEHRDGSNFKKTYHEHRVGSHFGKVVTKIEMDEQDRNRRERSGHE